MESISVLGLNNNFYGSYSSNQVFFFELMKAFRMLGATVYTAETIEQAVEVLENKKVDFSVCFSKYNYFQDGIALYDKYRVMNYQWVSDNPLKMNLDINSQWIKYIFIDDEYPMILPRDAYNTYMFRPLGFLNENILPCNESKTGILVPCKIRNLREIEDKINSSSYSKIMKKFLDEYDRDSSYIMSIKAFFNREGIFDIDSQSIIFRLTNEYTRIEKRLFVINNIEDYEVDVLSVDCNNKLKNRNIHFITPINYSEISDLINSYKYVINVDPNYHACFHDRFIKTVSSGTVCLTNDNITMKKMNPYTYSFSSGDSILRLIEQVDKDYMNVYEYQLELIKPYSWEKSAQLIIDDSI